MICEKNVWKYCCEDISLIENYYEAINSNEMWVCHHRLEIQGDEKYSKRQLIEMRLYYERPANELIFMTPYNHRRLHNLGKMNPNYHREFSKEHRERISKSKANIPESTRQKMREAKLDKKLSEEHKRKIRENHKSDKGIPQPKYKWLTPTGIIRIMDMANAHRHHPDWKLIDKLL